MASHTVSAVPSVPERPRFGLVQGGIVVLTLFTAAVHAYYVVKPDEPPWVRVSFTGVTLAYLGLLAALYLPTAVFRPCRRPARVLLIALAVVTIIGYFVVGGFDTLGNVTKGGEVLLIVLLVVDGFSRR